jgi:hypothetical protein
MSMEEAINNHAAAILVLAKAIQGKGESASTPAAGKSKPAATTSPATPAKGTAAATSPAAGEAAPDFEHIKTAFVALVKAKGQQAAPDLLAHFGIDASKGGKLSHIPVERHAELAAEIAKRSA